VWVGGEVGVGGSEKKFKLFFPFWGEDEVHPSIPGLQVVWGSGAVWVGPSHLCGSRLLFSKLG